MNDVSGGEGLERRVPAVPLRAQPARHTVEIARGFSVLKVRGEQSEASLEHLCRPGHALARENGGGDPALRRPSRVQELRVRPIDPAFQDARGEAAADAGGARHLLGIQAKQPAGQIRHPEWREQSRWMKAPPVELSRRDAADAAGYFVADCDRRRRDPARDTGAISAIASAEATAGLLMWTIDSLWVSSYSSACAHAPFANAAVVTPTVRRIRTHRHGPGGDIATAAARVDRPNGVSAPASASPMTSRIRSFVASTTSSGRSSNATLEAQAPSVVDGQRFVVRRVIRIKNRPSCQRPEFLRRM